MNSKQSILFRLMGSFAIIVALLVAVGLVGFFALNSAHVELKAVAGNNLPSIDFLDQSDRDLQQALVAERSLFAPAISEKDREGFYAVIEENVQQSRDRAEKYHKLADTKEEEALYQQYLSARRDWEKNHGKMLRLYQSGNEANRVAAMNLSLGPVAADFEKMRNFLDQLEELVLAHAAEAEERAGSLFVKVATTLFIVSIVAIFTAIFLGVLLSRSIVVPIRAVIKMTDRIVDGDLSDKGMEQSVIGSKEISMLISSIIKLASVLRDQVGAIKESASALLRESSHMMSATSQLASAASEQASSIAQTTATVEELKQTGRTTSDNAKQIVEVSTKSVEISQTGLSAVDASSSDIRRIFDQVEAIVLKVDEVRVRVNEVDDIIATVNKVADQSNLLSVNASIEASKAGEYGRGFTVVAQEVKNLAEQSSKATTRVRAVLENIQSAIEKVVFEASTGRERAETGVTSIEKTGGIISSLGSDISESVSAAKQIATSANANSVGLEQIAQAMTDINQAAVENQKSAIQVEDGGQALNKLAENMEMLVSHYKLR